MEKTTEKQPKSLDVEVIVNGKKVISFHFDDVLTGEADVHSNGDPIGHCKMLATLVAPLLRESAQKKPKSTLILPPEKKVLV